MEKRLVEDIAEIRKIIEEKIKGKKLFFTDWYKIGLMRKGISEETFDEVFPQFEKVIAIEIEELKNGAIGYELFYKQSGNLSISIATIPFESKIKIIHLVEYKRSLNHRFKKFKR